ncbi:MAG: hypothetical protein QOI78_3679 [Actinomycetota bacterium]|nr:hypothetical protein [Actinomycetota bacterium]
MSHGYLDGIQAHNVWEKSGCGTTFNSTNHSDCVSRKKPNVIGASNTSTGGKGVSKTPVTPGT